MTLASSSPSSSTTARMLNQPDLPFGDINLVVLTDVHSWVAGHSKNEAPDLDVSYGDVLSFYERLSDHCQSNDMDLFFVQNGDWIDGTGLATDGDPSSLIPLIEKMPFDVLNTGNHELYRDSVIDYMHRPGGFLDWWGDRHLASNVYMATTAGRSQRHRNPFSNRYTMLHGKHSSVLVFGFLYDMPNPSNKVIVQHVEDAINESWFQTALKEETYDAILVMTHAGHDDPAVAAIHQAIRKNAHVNDRMPIQFIAGHTHYRRHALANDDPLSPVVEAGRFLDTVGFVSFPNVESVSSFVPSTSDGDNSTSSSSPADLFHHVFLNANKKTLQSTLGIASQDDFPTKNGQAVQTFIDSTMAGMGLTKKIGCAPRNYMLNVSIDRDDSLWRLYRDEVVPHELQLHAPPDTQGTHVHRVIVAGQGSWRYDLYGGNELTYDDIIAVSPFNEPMYRVATVPGHIVETLTGTMNNASDTPYYSSLPAYILAGTVDPHKDCELYAHHFGLSSIQDTLRQVYPEWDETDSLEINITSTSIWFSFVANRWKCSGGLLDNPWLTTWPGGDSSSGSGTGTASSTDKLKMAVSLLVASIFLCCTVGILFVACRYLLISMGILGNAAKDYGEMEAIHSRETDGDGCSGEFAGGNSRTRGGYANDNEDELDGEVPVQIV